MADHDRTWVSFDMPDARSLLAGEDVWAFHPTTRNIPNCCATCGSPCGPATAPPGPRRLHRGGVAVPFFVIAWVLRIPTVYVEVFDRIDSPTLTAGSAVLHHPLSACSGRAAGALQGHGRDRAPAVTDPTGPEGPYRVVVTVGTDRHPSPGSSAGSTPGPRPTPTPVLLQLGTTDPPPPVPSVRAVALLPHQELVAAMAEADVVVAQGGPGGIMDARSVGRQPVAVPPAAISASTSTTTRCGSAWMAERGLVHLATDEATLLAELDAGLADPARLRIPPDGGGIDDTIAAFRGVVEPLLVARRRRR
ncbi:MAG: hypothetical protein R2746_05265 [Acidimicrobiales bacterium]